MHRYCILYLYIVCIDILHFTLPSLYSLFFTFLTMAHFWNWITDYSIEKRKTVLILILD